MGINVDSFVSYDQIQKIEPYPVPKDINKMIDLFKNVSSSIIQKMCIKATEACPALMYDVPDQYRTLEMYIKVVEKHPGWMYTVPDRFKTKRICEKAVRREPYLL